MLKKLYINLAFLLIASASFGQFATKWHKTIGNSAEQIAQSIIEVSDGNFLVVGHSKTKHDDSDLFLAKIDVTGRLLWENTIDFPKYQFGESVVEMDNGDFMITGQTNYNSKGSHDLWLLRVDRNGKLIWEHSFGGISYEIGNCISKTSDGGLIISGSIRSKGFGNDDIWVLKLNRYGHFVWEKTFGGFNSEKGNSVIEAKNGDFLITGSTSSLGYGRKDINLLRVSKLGKKVWSKTFGGYLNDEGNEVFETANEEIVIVGSSVSDNYPYPQSVIIKTDKNGEVIWENYFGEQKRSAAFALSEMTNGDIAVAGYVHSLQTSYDIQLTIFNKNGEHYWHETYGGVSSEEANDIIISSDDKIVIAGYTKSYSKSECDIWTLMLEQDITPYSVENPELLLSSQILSDVDSNIPETGINGRNTLAVIIGIEKYKYLNQALYAKHDAEIFYQYAKSVFGIPERNILFITNENATSAEFEKAFMKNGWLDKRSDKNTEIIIYYAGHALPDENPGIDEVYLTPYDVDGSYVDISGVGVNQLIKNLGSFEAKSAVMFLDACYTGIANSNSNYYAGRRVIDKEVAYSSNVSVMLAADETETAIPFPEKKHGLFTYFLLKGLQGKALGYDNKITLQELYDYVRANVSHEAGFMDSRQTPQLIATDKQIIITEY